MIPPSKTWRVGGYTTGVNVRCEIFGKAPSAHDYLGVSSTSPSLSVFFRGMS